MTMRYGNGKYVEEKWELQDCTVGRGVWRHFDVSDGDYKFTVFLPEDLYIAMADEGWYVKHKEKYAGDQREFQIDVGFRFDKYPPNITMITDDGARVPITEDNVAILQTADFERVDLVIRPYNWQKDSSSGVSAKLDSMDVYLRRPRRRYNASFGSHVDEDDEE